MTCSPCILCMRVRGEEGSEQLLLGCVCRVCARRSLPCAACEAARRQAAEGCRGLTESGGVVVVGLYNCCIAACFMTVLWKVAIGLLNRYECLFLSDVCQPSHQGAMSC